MPVIIVTIFSVCKIGPVNIQSFQTTFLVKGPGLCNTEIKVM